MPKINVYLPEELAEAVKAAELPVSAICQRALEQSVKRATAIRATVLGDLDTDDPTAGLTHFTERARTALKLAITAARGAGATTVGTEHLLHGLISEGSNLALRILRTEELDPALVQRTLDLPEPGAHDGPQASRFGADAANALELTAVEAMALGHNYVGCEHLLLGIVAEPDGAGGRVLRELGLDARSARKAVAAALSGYAHLRAQAPDPTAAVSAALTAALAPVVARIERLEQRLG
ncbi:Clp protease N-terminal domain-containing protein [Labedaea rhizosphaerae]|nr:Clp protease N-terminal domain-containing protein [Labedaea rhizosphaerae]